MTQQPELTNINTRYGRIIIHPDEIVSLHLLDDLPIDTATAQQMITDVQALLPTKEIRLLVLQGFNSELSFGAQYYFVSVTGFSRVAFVVRSRMQAEVGQFLASFLQAFKISYEFKLFHKVDTAMAWLRQQ